MTVHRYILGVSFGIALVCACGCDPKERAAERANPEAPAMLPSTSLGSEAHDKLTEMVDIGEKRVFGPDGPKYQLPKPYFEYARAHPRVAIQILRDRITSSDGLHRMNAIEFLAELRHVGEVAEEATQLIQGRLDDDADFVRNYAAATLRVNAERGR